MGRRRALQLTVSILVTVGFAWWAFRDTHWGEQWKSLREANYFWLLPYLALLLVLHVIRAVRWGCWLSAIDRVPFKRLNEATAVGTMMVIALPFRLGELARPFLIAQKTAVKQSEAMMSVVLERIVDGLCVAVSLRLFLGFIDVNTPELRYARWGSNFLLGAFGGGMLFLLLALRFQEPLVALVRATVGRVSKGFADKVADITHSFVGAMRRLPSLGQGAAFLSLTVIFWALNGVSICVLAKAFGLELTAFQSLVIIGVLVVGLMVPGAPGNAGTFQAAMKLGLSVFLPPAVVSSSGMALANVLWLCSTGQQVLTGLVFLWLGELSFRQLLQRLTNPREQAA